MDDGLNISTGQGDLKDKFDTSARQMIKVDVERYQAYLDDTNLTDAQKEEFLQAMWLFIVNLVELGFEVHPLQEVCGKDSGSVTQSANEAVDGVSSEEPHSD